METKICSICGEEKSIKKFRTLSTKERKRVDYCSNCAEINRQRKRHIKKREEQVKIVPQTL